MAAQVPPEDFRLLSVIPTLRDIITDERPFLTPNKIDGPYDNTQHYLDVQFRLLREDFVKPLRDGIQTLLVIGKYRTPKEERLLDVRVYDNVEIRQPDFTSNGIAYRIKFDISKFHRVQWQNSKRLIFGSLLCLSKDNFKSFAFATVANRELKDVAKGEIEIRFVSPPSEARPRTGDKCQMVESVAFFEAYRPVLEGLQSISERGFPFKKYIVECEKELHPPRYLRKYDGAPVKYDFSPVIASNQGGSYHRFGTSASTVTVLDSASWPSARNLGLDNSQFKALQLALTNEFAVIQGPPGTGKTYIGLKIAKILLHNKTVWRAKSKEGPILVVCYTNHALDQFLEEIYEFHKEGIVRVGGRSQSEVMKKCSLWETKKKMLFKRRIPSRLRNLTSEAQAKMNVLSSQFQDHKKIISTLEKNVVDEDELSQWSTSLTTQHYETLKNGILFHESVMPYWLGLPVEPPNPYSAGYSKPLLMFPFNDESRNREYFSNPLLAFISPDVQFAPGADGSRAGSVELRGNLHSFIEIANFEGGDADIAASGSITILAFLYPTGGHGPIICYQKNGYGFQIWFEQVEFSADIGNLCAWFVRRDLAVVIPIRRTILNINAWNFIGVSYDYWTGVARLWHNGNEVETVFIGAYFPLATQFPIRIGALDCPWQTTFFTGRISHLHIYSEALNIENIRAVGCISPTEEINLDSEQLGEATPEELKPSFVAQGCDDREESEGGTLEENQKNPDVRFETYVIEDQRILDGDDDFIRFDNGIADDERSIDGKSLDNRDHMLAARSVEEGQQQVGWRFQSPARVRKNIQRTIQRELRNQDLMSEEDASMVENVWNLCNKDRWRLYRRWVQDACEKCHRKIAELEVSFNEEARNLKHFKEQEDEYILSKADVIGMTTTGAARYQNVLQAIKPAITIVEEAAEVMEAHIITSLTPGCQHLILIGDHQQLRPNPTVYDLQINYNFDVSLFERMIKNGMEFARLCLQHRMRPEIAKMLDHIYVNPKLENHDSVLKFERIRGVQRNLFFLEHSEREDFVDEGRSRSNTYEAKFMTALCRYLIQQGYKQSQITILTAYTGQLSKLKREMSSKYKKLFEGVRVSVVDNFQGEENDIILLSLVRSDRSGFLKIDNRVCVALSRARKGFFIIGNSTVLARESALWRNIFKDMRKQGAMGKELRLTCQNHPKNGIQASSAADFDKAPKGGCLRPCGITMECGHTCNSVCHPMDLEHKEEFLCQQPCSKIICLSGHKCRNKCSQKCGPCMEMVTKVIPGCEHKKRLPCSKDVKSVKCKQIVPKEAFPCGHINQVPCSDDPASIKCKTIVPKEAWPCGHVNKVPCSDDAASIKCKTIVPKEAWPCGHVNKVPCSVMPSDIKCKMPCGELQCGHKCIGNCHQCHQGRLHKPCQSKCDRPLVCGHSCKDDCSRVCPPCSNKCENYCEHRACNKTCGDRCTPCTIECSWKCPHFSCTKPCNEPCNRPRCDKPCEKKLPCGHSCIGVCGEECPKLCRVCDEEADDFKGCEPQAMFVELVDCGHVFEVKTLDELMDKSQDKHGQNGKMEIRHKMCPKCSKPIRSSRRYGKIIKEILADFDAVKRQIITSDVAASDQIKNVVCNAEKIKSCRSNAEKIVNKIRSGRATPQEVIKLQNQVLFMKFLDSTIYLARTVDDKTLLREVYGLESRIMENPRCFSEQENEELIEEISRSKLLVSFRCFMAGLQSKGITLGPEDNTCVLSIQEALDSGKAIDRQRKQDFLSGIDSIKRKYGLQLQGAGTLDEDWDLTGKLAKAKNLTRGPWYKCIKGHVYPAADQIPAHKDNLYASCPHCVEETKSTPRTLTETLPPQMTPGEIASTMKPQPASSSTAGPRGRGRPSKNIRFRK